MQSENLVSRAVAEVIDTIGVETFAELEAFVEPYLVEKLSEDQLDPGF